MGRRDEELHRLADGESAHTGDGAMEGTRRGASDGVGVRVGVGDGAAAPPPLEALDEADRLRVAAIGDVGAAVRHALLAESEGVDVWSGIEKRLRQERVRSWRQRVRGRFKLVVPMAAAAAAVLLVWLGLGRGGPTNACDIELLDVRGAAAAVITVPDDRGSSTTVIWTTEEE